jgi:hypothetical protein
MTQQIRHRRKRQPTKAMKVAFRMPKLVHGNGPPFDIRNSECVRWMMKQPVILNAMFDYFVNRKCIVYNPVSKTWVGREILEERALERCA